MLYEGFVTFPPHERLEKELNELEYDDQRAKVDHPASGSKDVSDCLASVAVGLTYALPPYHWTRLDGLRIPHPETNNVTTRMICREQFRSFKSLYAVIRIVVMIWELS